jgi:hypothetical protein
MVVPEKEKAIPIESLILYWRGPDKRVLRQKRYFWQSIISIIVVVVLVAGLKLPENA